MSNLDELVSIVKKKGSAIIAYSGGVDSAFLLKVCVMAEIKILAVTFNSILYPKAELQSAEALAKSLNVEHIVLNHNPLDEEELKNNPKERCYICKKHIYSKLIELKDERNFQNVFDGNNFDDLSMYRPGVRAIDELGIVSPLALAKFTKSMVRECSKELGLPTWNKPSFACYFSRFDYGESVTEEKINQVMQVETAIHALGLISARVRHHRDVVRVEMNDNDFINATTVFRQSIINIGKLAGFRFITIDLEGYRSGSFDK